MVCGWLDATCIEWHEMGPGCLLSSQCLKDSSWHVGGLCPPESSGITWARTYLPATAQFEEPGWLVSA